MTLIGGGGDWLIAPSAAAAAAPRVGAVAGCAAGCARFGDAPGRFAATASGEEEKAKLPPPALAAEEVGERSCSGVGGSDGDSDSEERRDFPRGSAARAAVGEAGLFFVPPVSAGRGCVADGGRASSIHGAPPFRCPGTVRLRLLRWLRLRRLRRWVDASPSTSFEWAPSRDG